MKSLEMFILWKQRLFRFVRTDNYAYKVNVYSDNDFDCLFVVTLMPTGEFLPRYIPTEGKVSKWIVDLEITNILNYHIKEYHIL